MRLEIADDNPGCICVYFHKRYGDIGQSARALHTDGWALDVCKHMNLDSEETGWHVSSETFKGLNNEVKRIQGMIRKLEPYREDSDGKSNT